MRGFYPYRKITRNILYLLLAGICGVSCCEDNDILLTINGDEISRTEFVAQMNMEKASVFDFFQKKYQAGYQPGFWNTSYGGETPLQKLKAQALKELTGIYVKRQLAVELGILHSSTYAEWRKDFYRENERRAAAIANGQVIYGPSRFDLTAYTGYYLSNLENQMKEVIRHQSGELTAEALHHLYAANKESAFRVMGSIRIAKITVPQQIPVARMRAVVQHVQHGLSFKAAATKEGFVVVTQWLTAATTKADRMYTPLLWQTIQQLPPGEVSDILAENGQYELVCVLQKEADMYKPLPEVREWLIEKQLEDRYQSLLREKEQAAQINIRKAAMEKLVWEGN